MPKPPILDEIDWKPVFESAMTYASWLDAAEEESNAGAVRQFYDEQPIHDGVQSELAGLSRPIHVLAIAEDWCPDVIRHVPVLQKLADQSECISVRYMFREDHPEIFQRFLTNGGEAIPKFIFLNDQFAECSNWGPMIQSLVNTIARGKACGDMAKAREKVFAAYIADTERLDVVDELMHCIRIAAAETP